MKVLIAPGILVSALFIVIYPIFLFIYSDDVIDLVKAWLPVAFLTIYVPTTLLVLWEARFILNSKYVGSRNLDFYIGNRMELREILDLFKSTERVYLFDDYIFFEKSNRDLGKFFGGRRVSPGIKLSLEREGIGTRISLKVEKDDKAQFFGYFCLHYIAYIIFKETKEPIPDKFFGEKIKSSLDLSSYS